MDIVTIAEFAAMLGVTEKTIRNQLYTAAGRTNLPPARRFRRKIFFLRQDVAEFFRKLPVINRDGYNDYKQAA